ncbi:tight junction protein ZO-1-like isoform X2 [Anneissia japonica]|uniref:tight junction protein ZO-1-like isoform X2 n=1 Tax=Anneissia japonica TaxID=1529436 RepID=UPI001425981F|nr:tight junction protein ZO-1-like isoform X2 [Anneissia japonica]
MQGYDDPYGRNAQPFVRGRQGEHSNTSSFFRKKKKAKGGGIGGSNLSRSESHIMWETLMVTINRESGLGFGIAISGGRDNPHYMTDEDAIVISDVLAQGPAEHLVKVNDRVLAVNNKSMEGAEHDEAINALKESGNSVTLHIKRPLVDGLTRTDGGRSNIQSVQLYKEGNGYGMKLGIKLYIEDMSPTGSAAKSGLTSGDNIVAINGMPIEAMSLPDAKKIIQTSRGSLLLDIKKEPKKREKPVEEKPNLFKPKSEEILNDLPEPPIMSPPPGEDPTDRRHSIEDHGLPPPPPDTPETELDIAPPRPPPPDHHNGMDGSYLPDEPILSQVDPPQMSTPPPPGESRVQDTYIENSYGRRDRQPSYEPPAVTPGSEERQVSFIKGKSIGLQLVGGNATGIFVAAMQPGSAAEKAGVHEGDQILQVNDVSLLGMTKEDAVLMLLSLVNEIRLVCRYDKRMCDEVMQSGKGDDFYVRTHFNYEGQRPEEITFFKNNIFRVIDTMYEGMVGWWYVLKIGHDEHEEARGIIPNNSRAEQLALSQPPDYYMKPQTTDGRSSFFKRRRKSFRSTKNLIKDQWDRVVFGGTPPKFPPYERVALKDPEFVRPVVIFGPLADIAREKLLADYDDKFDSPYNPGEGEGESQGTIKVHAIREIMGKGKHCILDITPNAVERLNFAQFYPIVIFLRPDNRATVKQLRGKHLDPEQNRGSRKLTQTAKNLNKVFVHIFSDTVRLGPDVPWFSLTHDAILKQQNKPIWMSDVSVPKEEQEPELPIVGELTLPSDYESDAESAFSGAESTYNDSMVESDYEADRVPSPEPKVDHFRTTNDYTLPTSFTEDYRSPREPRSSRKTKPYSPDTDEEYGGDMSDGSTGYVPQNKPSPNRRHNRPNEASRRRKEEREREERERHEREREEQERKDREDIERRERERQEKEIQNKKKREQLEKERERERELIREIERQQEERRREAEIKMSRAAPSFDEPTIMDPVTISQSYSHQSYSSPPTNVRTFEVDVDMPPPPVDSPVASSSTYSVPSKPATKPRYDPTQFTSSTLMNYSKPEVKPRPPKHTTDSRDNMPELVKVEAVVHPSRAQPLHTSFPASQAMETTFGVDDYVQPNAAEDKPRSYWQPAKETDLDSYTATPAETTFPAEDEPSYNGINGSYKSDNNNQYGSKDDPASPYYNPNMEPVKPGIPFNSERDHRIKSYQRLQDGPFAHESSSRGRTTKTREFEGFDRVLNTKAPYEKQSYKAYREATRPRDQSPGSSYLKSSLYTPAAWSSSRQNNDHLRGEVAFKSVKAPQGKGSQDNLDKADNGETPVDQIDGQTVLATAKGMFDHKGGTLTSEETGVSILIPEGALPYGEKQEIYFKVCRDNSMLPPLDKYKGETLLSPLVMCGPHNLKFLKPVELRLPHQTSMTPDGWSFNLKSSDTPAGQPAKWKNLKIDDDQQTSKTVVGTKTVSVMVDHF